MECTVRCAPDIQTDAATTLVSPGAGIIVQGEKAGVAVVSVAVSCSPPLPGPGWLAGLEPSLDVAIRLAPLSDKCNP